MYTPVQVIRIAKVSQYLAENDIDKKGLYGGGMDLLLPKKLYSIRKNVSWMYQMNPSDSSLQATANYLLALCGRYGAAAQAILSQNLITELDNYPSEANIITQGASYIVT
jgi:hypothetical protein